MRLDIYGQFVGSVITPKGGWSKGRPVALIEGRRECYPIDLLIPNDLSEDQLQRYVTNRFSTFAASTLRVAHHPICDANRPQTSQGDIDVKAMLTVASHSRWRASMVQCVAGAS